MQRRNRSLGKVRQWRRHAALRRLWCLLFVLCAVACLPARCVAQTSANPLRNASAIAFDAAGNLYIADAAAHQVWKATLGGSLALVAGNGTQGYAGDGGPATAAELNEPQGLAVGADGTLYVADAGNHCVRAVSPGGVISTFAGSGTEGDSGDGGVANEARLRAPKAVAVGAGATLLIADTAAHRLRRVSAGVITAFAGSGVQGTSGDGGSAGEAMFDAPSGLAVDGSGAVYVADSHADRVRRIDAAGKVSTFVGTGARGFGGDGGPALSALLSSPRGLVWTPEGDLLIADEGNQRVRKVNSAGVISTVAGSGVEGLSADGASGTQAAVRAPRGVAVSSFGLPVVADALNGTVRELTGGGVLYQPAALVAGRSSKLSVQATAAATYGDASAVSVAVSGGVGAPQGQVTVLEGGKVLGTSALSAAGAQVPVGLLPAGQHTFAVAYGGDGLNPAGTASVAGPVIAKLPVVAIASSSEAVYGQAPGLFTGVISGVLPQDTDAVQAAFGVASGQTFGVGTYPITATLAGAKAANYVVSMSQGSGMLQITKAPALAALQGVGSAQAFAGLPLPLQATVASTTSGSPTGTVQFLDGATVVATAELQGGLAQATYTSPAVGAHPLTVQYLGDRNFLPVSSGAVSVAVAALPDFTVTAAGAQSASAGAGGTASFSFTVSSQGAPFTGAVLFSATGAPGGGSVAFSPPAVVPGAQSAKVTMTVQVPVASASLGQEQFPAKQRGRPVAALVVSGVLACALWRRRAMLPRVLCLIMLLAGMAGCGARTVGEGTNGVLAQSYTVQVTGTATNLAGQVVVHSVPFTLTVQP